MAIGHGEELDRLVAALGTVSSAPGEDCPLAVEVRAGGQGMAAVAAAGHESESLPDDDCSRKLEEVVLDELVTVDEHPIEDLAAR